jgi:hypothetical protein
LHRRRHAIDEWSQQTDPKYVQIPTGATVAHISQQKVLRRCLHRSVLLFSQNKMIVKMKWFLRHWHDKPKQKKCNERINFDDFSSRQQQGLGPML